MNSSGCTREEWTPPPLSLSSFAFASVSLSLTVFQKHTFDGVMCVDRYRVEFRVKCKLEYTSPLCICVFVVY